MAFGTRRLFVSSIAATLAAFLKAFVEDARELFVRFFCLPALQAGAIYEDRYPLATALARPLTGPISRHSNNGLIQRHSFRAT